MQLDWYSNIQLHPRTIFSIGWEFGAEIRDSWVLIQVLPLITSGAKDK